MTRRVTITETNAPAAIFAEAFARLLLEREKARPALAIVDKHSQEANRYKLSCHDPSRPVSKKFARQS